MATLENIADELHRPARKIFRRRHVVTRFRNELLQADLIDFQTYFKKNNGLKYILVVIDTYTKFVWVEPLKNKTGKVVTKHMANILKKVHPKLLQTDNGTEFYNKDFQDLMKKYKIKHYSTYSVIKAGMAERVIKTLKNKIYQNFTATGSWNWSNSLVKIILNYNNTKHSTIKCTPYEAQLNPNKIKIKLETKFKKKKK